MRKKQLIVSGLGLLLFLSAAYFPLFLHLDDLPLRLWDEARRGVNALEMASGGHWLTPHFNGLPDNWGTKPPLLIWLQSICLQLISSPELAIRLPSALSGLATALVLVWAGKRILNRPLAGYFAGIVLLTSSIYFDAHGAVAGDYDALLSLWLTAHVLTFFLFVSERKDLYLYLSGLFLVLAGWTKGIAAFFLAPGMCLFLLSSGATRQIFRNKKLYLVAVVAFMGILSYYLIREYRYPGYLATVWDNELGGRYFEPKEGHGWGFGFYFRVINKYLLFFPWQYFLPLSFLFLIRDQKTKSFGYYLLTITITFLLTISSSATKLIWYVLPVIPLLSLAIGFGLERLYCGLVNLQGRIVPGFRLLLLALFAVAVFAFPYIEILQKVYHPEPSAEERERVSYRDFFRQLPAGRSYTMVLPGYNGHFSFYQQYFNQKGNKIGSVYLNPPDEQVQFSADTTTWFLPGASIGVCEGKAKAFMDNHYLTDTLQSWENCKLLRIKERKPQ